MPYVTFLVKKRLGGGPLPVAKYHALMNPGALIFGPDGKLVDIDPAGAVLRDAEGNVMGLDPARLPPDVAAALVRDEAGRIIDIDPMKLPGTTVLYDARNPGAKGPGRPRLGVTAREVTLLPRHWDWLAAQPGGASVALRKLVEAAMRQTMQFGTVNTQLTAGTSRARVRSDSRRLPRQTWMVGTQLAWKSVTLNGDLRQQEEADGVSIRSLNAALAYGSGDMTLSLRVRRTVPYEGVAGGHYLADLTYHITPRWQVMADTDIDTGADSLAAVVKVGARLLF